MWITAIALAIDGRGLVERPPALEPAQACSLWKGTASGNDPSTLLELELCGQTSVTGRLQWSSTLSGHNLRLVEGTWTESGLILGDTSMPVSEPAPGWFFCTIERYELRRVGPSMLTGTFWSSACDDTASISLSLIEGTPPEPPAASADGSPGATPASGWGCATLPAIGGGLWCFPLWLRRRRWARDPRSRHPLPRH